MRHLLGKIALAGLVAQALASSGCAHPIGPRTIRGARFDYGAALARSWDEQLLLNLVRLRYRDTPLFLEVGSVVTHYSLDAAATAGGDLGVDGNTGGHTVAGTSIAWSESPTITYTPLQGQDFVARLLAPITPANLVLFSQNGWSVERLLLCCVQKINGLRNAVAAAGPTPDYAPTFADFQQLARALRKLQVAGLMDAETTEDGKTLLLSVGQSADPALVAAAAEAKSLLGLPAEVSTFRIVPHLIQRKPDEVAITGRSLLSVLFYLSQAVEVPAADEEAKRVTVTKNEQGERFDWTAVTGNVLRIHTAAAEPRGTAVKVRYRDHWFYIDDTDLNSKTTFTLLSYLFSLKAGSQNLQEPVLTLGVR
jgi:hypothetical protein